jgi:hypothetical protein
MVLYFSDDPPYKKKIFQSLAWFMRTLIGFILLEAFLAISNHRWGYHMMKQVKWLDDGASLKVVGVQFAKSSSQRVARHSA